MRQGRVHQQLRLLVDLGARHAQCVLQPLQRLRGLAGFHPVLPHQVRRLALTLLLHLGHQIVCLHQRTHGIGTSTLRRIEFSQLHHHAGHAQQRLMAMRCHIDGALVSQRRLPQLAHLAAQVPGLQPRAVVRGIQPQRLRKRLTRRHPLRQVHQTARLLQPGRHQLCIVLQGLFVQGQGLGPVVLLECRVAGVEGLGDGLRVERFGHRDPGFCGNGF